MKRPLLYVAGPYSADTKEKKIANIEAARKIAIELWDRGYAVICPHSNTAFFNKYCKVATYDDFVNGDLVMVGRCDGLVCTPDWYLSPGAHMEVQHALYLNIPVFILPYLPPSLR